MPKPQFARLPDGRVIERKSHIAIRAFGYELIPVADYDDHFLYESKQPNAPAVMCTCGSAGVVAEFEGVRQWVCYHHFMYGHHTNLPARWI